MGVSGFCLRFLNGAAAHGSAWGLVSIAEVGRSAFCGISGSRSNFLL